MGRVARYKKIKSCDPYSKQNSRGRKPTTLSGERVWGLTEDDRTVKVKKRSRTAERLRAQKQQRRDKRKRKPEDGDDHDDDNDNISAKKSSKGFDLPPAEGDDFDLKDLVSLKAGSNKNIKRQKTVEEEVAEDELKNASASVTVGSAAASTTTATTVAAAARLEMQQEVKVNRLLQLDTQLEKRAQQQEQESSTSALNRLPGESKNAYGRRMKEETRKLLKRNVQALANPDKRQRKKDFLNAKKKNGKNSKGKANIGNRNAKDDEDDDDNDDDDVVVKQDSFVTGEQAVAKRSAATASTAAASTGGSASSTWALRDQVERPPVFAQLPRGATAKKNARQNAVSSKQKKSLNPTEEQKVMEQMRLKVQAQYEVMKKKRRGEGFHL